MLHLTVMGEEFYNEETQEFEYPNTIELELEHSLVSLSKWESKFEKPFLAKDEKSNEEILEYIYMMILTPGISREILEQMSEADFIEINEYINAKMTATWFTETEKEGKSQEVITSELIYYWMLSYTIPMECQFWHLNRLFTLIRICHVKNSKPKQMSKAEIAARNRALNEKRRKQLGTTG